MTGFNQVQAMFAQAVQCFQRGDLTGAEVLCQRLISSGTRFPPAYDVLGNIHLRRGAFAGAEAAFQAALELDPDSADFRVNLAIAQMRQHRYEAAEASARQVLSRVAGNIRALSVLGPVLRGQKRFEEAVECGRAALAANPNFPPAHADLGAAFEGLERYDEALSCYEQALRLAPNFPEAWCAKGKALASLHRYQEAEAAFRQALVLRPGFAAAYSSLAEICAVQGRHDEAIVEHRKAVAAAPDDPAVHFAFGRWYQMRSEWEAAALSFTRALDLRADYAEAACELGAVFHCLFRLNDAVKAYRRALATDPGMVEAMLGLGRVHLEAGRDADAIAILSQARRQVPSARHFIDMLVLARLQGCAWEGLEQDRQTMAALIRKDEVEVNPFVAILAGMSSHEQLLAARRWARSRTPSDAPLFQHAPSDGTAGRRIRIGYLSADFHEHATAHLMAGVFEHHDRDRFETYAYCLGFDDGSAMRRRLVAAFDRFTEVEALGAAETARRIHADGIDILVDLKGYTGHGEPAILAYRPAPVQVSFLGYPGTMGAPFVDYVIADRITLPLSEQSFFDERVVTLPHCYQPNDSERRIADRMPTRSECGLPDDAFVFCSFNNPNKLTRDLLAQWMRLLQAVPGSVLWLLDPNATAKGNLLAEVTALGGDPGRLVFASRLPLAEHLARHRLADLFLDTVPVNAHTTASDALWAGLPLLTRMGEAFAGRVAASLLTTLGLSDLIAHSAEEYEAMAVRLARDPKLLAEYRTRLEAARLSSPLFDTALFTRNIEAAYERMWERWQSGGKPEAFAV